MAYIQPVLHHGNSKSILCISFTLDCIILRLHGWGWQRRHSEPQQWYQQTVGFFSQTATVNYLKDLVLSVPFHYQLYCESSTCTSAMLIYNRLTAPIAVDPSQVPTYPDKCPPLQIHEQTASSAHGHLHKIVRYLEVATKNHWIPRKGSFRILVEISRE